MRAITTFGTTLGLATTVALAQFSPAWDAYANNSDAHPNIPNVSYAGYQGGGVALPDGVGTVLISVTDYGAAGNGVTDDTAAVRAAIADAATMNGAAPNGVTVFFPSGSYLLSGPLLIHDDNVQLRGVGQAQTRLLFDGSLTSTYAAYPNGGGDSGWSFTGGMIWFTDQSRNPYFSSIETIDGTGEGFLLTDTRNITTAASLGDRTITVSSASGYSAGDVAVIEIDNADDLSTLRHLLGDGEWAQNYMFMAARDGSIMPSGRSSFRVYHTIESISGNQVTLREPLRFDLRSGWDPELRRPQVLRREVGLADMTIQLMRDYEWTQEDNHNAEPGFNGVSFTDVVDGFMDNVTIIDPGGLAVHMNYCKNVTISGVTIESSTPNRNRHHHAFVLANSTDCLIEEFNVRSEPLHGLYLGNFAVNNVYSRGVLSGGTFDYHKRLPYANVITEVQIANTGSPGGASASGPHIGGRHAHWNIDLGRTSSRWTAQPDIMPLGALVGIQCGMPSQPLSTENGDPEVLLDQVGPFVAPAMPLNLYEAQLALRLGQNPSTMTAPAPCPTCRDDLPYNFVFGGDDLGDNLVGQDNWVFDRDFTGTDGDNVRLEVVNDHPEGPRQAAVNRPGRDSVIFRENDNRFAFAPHAFDETSAVFRFDARVGSSSDSSGNAYLIVSNNPARDEGIQFGMSRTEFQIRGGVFSGVLQTIAPIPSGWFARGEWARLELRVDFTAGSNGEASLFFMNLSDGDSSFRAVPGLQDVPLLGVVQYPETWDRIGFRIRRAAAVTNVIANVGALSDYCCAADRNGDNRLTVDGDLTPLIEGLAAQSPGLDLNRDGSTDVFDLLDYLEDYNAGCP